MKSNHYTILPPIAYELSFGSNPKFRSEIRPKKAFVKKLKKDLQSSSDPETRHELQKKIILEEQIIKNRNSALKSKPTKSQMQAKKTKKVIFEPQKKMEIQKKIIGEIIDEKNKVDITNMTIAMKNDDIFSRHPRKMVNHGANSSNKKKMKIPTRKFGKPYKNYY